MAYKLIKTGKFPYETYDYYLELDDVTEIIKTFKRNLAFFHVHTLSSEETRGFSGTKDMAEALSLMRNGCPEIAKTLEAAVHAEKIKNNTSNLQSKPAYGIQGYQASTPRYLQGLPDSMVFTKRVAVKNKIVTIDKDVTYSSCISQEQIIKESVKALEIVRKIEACGKKVQLNVIYGVSTKTQIIKFHVTVKRANERLNIAKLAYTMVHPSMERRMMFALLERLPDITDERFTIGYGHILDDNEMKTEGNYFIPRHIQEGFKLGV